jgi:hypothetical protein
MIEIKNNKLFAFIKKNKKNAKMFFFGGFDELDKILIQYKKEKKTRRNKRQ